MNKQWYRESCLEQEAFIRYLNKLSEYIENYDIKILELGRHDRCYIVYYYHSNRINV